MNIAELLDQRANWGMNANLFLFNRRRVRHLDAGGMPPSDAKSLDGRRHNPYPVSSYVCDGTRLAVRLMGKRASVSVDGAAAVDLPAIGQSGTTFSNGRQTLLIEQGRTSWAVGRAMPVACAGG